MKLDRNRRYGIVYGDESENPQRPRKYYQDGMYFDGAMVAIEGSAQPKHVPPPSNTPVAVAEEKSTINKDIFKQLDAMSVPALKKIGAKVEKATGIEQPDGGTGVKARLVAYIAENAE